MKKILITGGSGLIGTILNNHLNANYDVQNLDRNKPKNKECFSFYKPPLLHHISIRKEFNSQGNF